MSFNEIRKHQENRRINILKGFSDFDYLHKDSESKNEFLEKGKRMPIGTISNGYKKIAEGRWQKVSSKGLTKKEHDEAADNSRNLYNTERDNYMDMMKKKEGRYPAGDGSDANKHFRDMENHQKESKNLDDKEYDDTHVFKEEIQKAKQYADNYQNRKLNRVGQTYGKDGQPESSSGEKQAPNANEDKIKQINSRLKELENINSKDAYDESQKLREFKTQLEAQNLHKNIDDSDVPQETQPNQEGQYSTDDLIGFAQEAEDWQLQEFINDAKASGDNSEYMQNQIRVAEQELNTRRGGVQDDISQNNVESNEENSDEAIDYNNPDSVKNFLNSNPDAKQAVVDMMMEDIFLSPAQALRLHQAQTQSGSEALQTVEEAKNMLDELHAKLGGNSEEGFSDEIVNNVINSLDENVSDELSDKELYNKIRLAAQNMNETLTEGQINDIAEKVKSYSKYDESEEGFSDDKVKNSIPGESSENPSTSPAGEPNRAENSEEEDEEDFDKLGTYEKAEVLLGKAEIGAKASGGGYTYTKKGKNHWVSSNGVTKNDAAISDMIGGFDDFKIK